MKMVLEDGKTAKTVPVLKGTLFEQMNHKSFAKINRRIIFLIFSYLCISVAHADTGSQEPKSPPWILGTSTWNVGGKFVNYNFVVMGTTEMENSFDPARVRYFSQRIDVYRSGEKIQELPTDGGGDQWDISLEGGDYNFDGYSDLRLSLKICLASKFCRNRYEYWLFDPKTGTFVECPTLTAIQGDLDMNPFAKTFSANEIEIGEGNQDEEIYIDTFYGGEGFVPKPLRKTETHHIAGSKKFTVINYNFDGKTWKEISRHDR